jgi:hypothetical protein
MSNPQEVLDFGPPATPPAVKVEALKPPEIPEWEKNFRVLYKSLVDEINRVVDDTNGRESPGDVLARRNSQAKIMVDVAFRQLGDTNEVTAMRAAVKGVLVGKFYEAADALLKEWGQGSKSNDR